MGADNSADKSREELWGWSQSDPRGLVDYPFALQTEVRRWRDAPFTQGDYQPWQQRYRELLRAGRQANPLSPEPPVAKRLKQSKEQDLLDRLEGYEDYLLAFLWAWELPFTNNEAERAFRMMKVRLKISGCFRTRAGARRHARIRSYISTLRKHGLPVLEYLRRALDGHPFLPQPAKTT